MLTVHRDISHHWDGAIAVFMIQLLFRPIFCSKNGSLKKIKLYIGAVFRLMFFQNWSGIGKIKENFLAKVF